MTTTDSTLAAAAGDARRLLTAQPNPQEAVCIAMTLDWCRERSGVEDVGALKAALYAAAADAVYLVRPSGPDVSPKSPTDSFIRAEEFNAATDKVSVTRANYSTYRDPTRALWFSWCDAADRAIALCRLIQAA